MLSVTLARLRLHTDRLLTTALAVVLGVAFTTGTLVFGDTLRHTYSSAAMGSADTVDVVAVPTSSAPIPPHDLARIRALPEVAAATGVVMASAPLLDAHGRALGTEPTLALSAGGDVTRHEAAEGRLPEADDEVALATTVAELTGFGIGDTVAVLDPDGNRHRFTVTGLIDFGLDPQIARRGALALTPRAAWEMTGTAGFAEIDVRAAEGVSAAEARQAVAEVLGAVAKVRTGAQFGAELSEEAGVQARLVTTALLLFAAVALFVAALVVSNTFAILLAQRQREMALLRCVGATRGQVLRAVLLEALAIGGTAATVGAVAGAGLAAGAVVGGDLADPVVRPWTVAAGVVAGTAMTVAAALVPARRATRVAPLAVLRDSDTAADLDTVGKRPRIAGAAALSALSAASVAAALLLPPGPEAMALAVLGGAVCFLAVLALGPLLVVAAVRAAGPLLRCAGVSGVLAADSVRRAPRRTATAMTALTVGATLITGYSVVTASITATLDDVMARELPADYVLSPQSSGEEIPAMPHSVAATLARSPAVDRVFSVRVGRLHADGSPVTATAYLGARLGVDISGRTSAGDLADVGPGTVALSADDARRLGADVGDTVELRSGDAARALTVAAVTTGMGTVVDPTDFAVFFPGTDTDASVLVVGAPNASGAELSAAVDAAVADHPLVQVNSAAAQRAQYGDLFDTVFVVVTALLAMAIAIAVVGIANTMALSVVERRRESALLRALGLSTAQLGWALTVEAVLVCLVGALVGTALGAVFGWAAAAAALPYMVPALPLAHIGGLVAAAAAGGLLAVLLPARVAARTPIVAALTDR